ncbi:MAG: bifunctional 5,10-methylenetetrahydrofolate dehydrogenase/5,10-methenyltetrahydrofolate cyclohydrolase [Aigarchaeota archaeon]|nr:bifunctional 5,10-methylenetetrahydrofolate dehydrogenase/5,10-methenyltetrahydrofolate cyclohydrolase [Aigarchaeota archaeon]MDW8092727.1 bifunctional 5,10-methylenetetrahydrofolate dehydrogenase/5,10-methenyltetrahydrofolate cyclohydrolase [Nitrososphaerota archaeon]
MIIDAKPLFIKIREEVKAEVSKLKERGITPGLAAILSEDDPTSKLYVSKKVKDCAKCGIYSEVWEIYRYPPEERENELINLISYLNLRHDVTGILVQLPLPSYIDVYRVFDHVSVAKDVDGLTPTNKGKQYSRYDPSKDLLPCTAIGIVELLDHYRINVDGMFVTIIGRSDLVGKPLLKLLLDRNATPVCLHTHTRNALSLIAEADMVVSAVGRPPELYGGEGFKLRGEMIKEGAVVVNVGLKRTDTGLVYYDVDFDSVVERASFVTKNETVGYMTRARLLKNTVIATREFARSLEERSLTT